MTAKLIRYIWFSLYNCLDMSVLRVWKTWETWGISFFQTCKHPMQASCHPGKKVKGATYPYWGVGGVLISLSPWARRWIDHWVCDAWPVRRQTYGYLPSRRASPPLGRYQIIVLGDRGTWVWTTCPELLPGSAPDGSRTCNLSIASPAP